MPITSGDWVKAALTGQNKDATGDAYAVQLTDMLYEDRKDERSDEPTRRQ